MLCDTLQTGLVRLYSIRKNGGTEEVMPAYLDADTIFDTALERFRDTEVGFSQIRFRFRDFVQYFNDFGPIPDSLYNRAVAQMVDFVSGRLSLERDWLRYPEIARQKIEQPFFVIGHARSGTTILQCLLALDRGHRMPRYWEVRQPSPPPGLDAASDAASIAQEDHHIEDVLSQIPRLLAAHPYLEQGGRSEAECEDIMTLDFHMLHVMHFNRVPSLPYPIMPSDNLAAFRFHKRMLQQFQWKTPTHRWVCKGTTHQYFLPALWQVYPDAVCFWSHRAPEDYFASFFEMIEMIYQPVNGELYPGIDVERVVDEMKSAYQYVLSSDWIDDPRLCHIRFRDLLDDPLGVIGNAYRRQGLSVSKDFENAIEGWFDNDQNRSDRYGKFTYSLEKFGLSKKAIREAFSEYYERFDL
ncbi:MAG: hypothetical protein CMK32_16430 [Porticoccaceae bacterium]|nr:hypothetical protein [Porticoccaceae bacterium]